MSEDPIKWAFIAMAHHRLGQTGRAEAALLRTRELMEDPEAAPDEEDHAFLHEAENLIEGQATSPPPAEE